MSLSATLKPTFSSGDRSRGASYFDRGKVSHLEFYDNVISAEVEGSYSDYEVMIDLDDYDNDEGITCTCPRFDEGVLCKHVWATILRFDELTAIHESRTNAQTATSKKAGKKKAQKAKRNSMPQWQMLLNRVKDPALKMDWHDRPSSPIQKASAQQSEILYVVDAGSGSPYGPQKIELFVMQRVRRKDGQWGKLKPFSLSHSSTNSIADELDRQIAVLLLGVNREYSSPYSYGSVRISFSKFEFEPHSSRELSDLLVKSGRLYWTLDKSLPAKDFCLIEYVDLSNPATISIEITEQTRPTATAVMTVPIKRLGKAVNNSQVVKIADNGVVLLTDGLTVISNPESVELWELAKDGPPIKVKKGERNQFLSRVAEQDILPLLQLPDSWNVRKGNDVNPTPVLKLRAHRRENDLCGEVSFRYGDVEFALTSTNSTVYDQKSNTWFERDSQVESQRLQELIQLPITDASHDRWADYDFAINKKNLVRMVDELGQQGWIVQLHGKPVRSAGQFDIAVESGQDWFDLAVKVQFDKETIALPKLLQAISRKEHFVTLADGSKGRIPEEVVRKYSRIAGFGQVEEDKVRFRPSQAMLLDAMLDAREVRIDRRFRDFRRKLNSFKGVKPGNPPRSFQGKLRKYQTEGLGWLHFLRDFNLGGCLADDMGLGKTIQVLALLERRRTRRIKQRAQATGKKQKLQKKARTRQSKSKLPLVVSAVARLKRKPSIVVVPRSLIFNWIEEAARFTPRLRILNYKGTDRKSKVEQAENDGGFDVLITTYGTMRRDIADLSRVEFDYAILDESQAIKNCKAQCAKASRLLKADHRLAMTGTPIENHLGELWSLFEFLNPGMLGSSTNFARLTNQKKSNEQEREETLASLSRALQPYLLRRTKEQVLTDLPPKTEQILYCDMLPAQKKAYDELKEYYRVKLARQVETEGIGRSKIQVLEALLRLRQVACDPRLVDESSRPGAKLELLQQQIAEIASEGHKVLVFSQFTSFLTLVREQFDREGIKYEYLDGQSRNRAASVKRFQQDDSVQAFLISIKAGGHGLNLTSADYVFLLDPWWNPAVEAQAIDRAHRLGQTHPVIAYRMVCRDSVEEKIIQLQESKRELVDKIVRSSESMIRSLTVEDLKIIFE